MFQLTGYEPQDLIEKTLYQHVHTQDLPTIKLAHQACKVIFVKAFCFGIKFAKLFVLLKSTSQRPSDHKVL